MEKAGLVMSKDIREWFNPYDSLHMTAFLIYKATGKWPEGFPPSIVWCGGNWEDELDRRVQGIPVSQALRDQVDGLLLLTPPAIYGAKPRSPQWEKVNREWLAVNNECSACGARGTKATLRTHHMKPYHLFPELELDATNFITLCQSTTHNCHLIVGHGGRWDWWNRNVCSDAQKLRGLLQSIRDTCLLDC